MRLAALQFLEPHFAFLESIFQSAPTTVIGVIGLSVLGHIYTIYRLWQLQKEKEVPNLPVQAPACQLDHSGISRQLADGTKQMEEVKQLLIATQHLARETVRTLENVCQAQSKLADTLQRITDSQLNMLLIQTQIREGQTNIANQQQAIINQVNNLVQQIDRRRMSGP